MSAMVSDKLARDQSSANARNFRSSCAVCRIPPATRRGGVNKDGETIADPTSINTPSQEDAALGINLAKIALDEPCPNTGSVQRVQTLWRPIRHADRHYRNEPFPSEFGIRTSSASGGLEGTFSRIQ